MRSWFLAVRFARRELRGGLTGFRVFLACLILGVAAIAGVGAVSQSVRAGLAADAREILGGDLSIRLVHRPATAAQEAHLRANGETTAIASLHAMARTGDGTRRALVELKAVGSGYPLYGALETDPQLEAPVLLERSGGVWGAVVERSLLDRLGLDVGDRMTMGEAVFAIRAVVLREPDYLSSGIFHGPRVMVAYDALADTGLVQPGSLIYYSYRVRLPAGADVPAWIADLEREFPNAGWRVRTLAEAAPRITFLVERTTLFLTLVGLTTLLVGGVGVANAVRAYLEGKMTVIATLKCLGASSRLVFRTYLAQVMSLAVLGIGIGLVAGALAPLAAGALLQPVLPISIRFGLFPEPLAAAALFGLLTALTFSLWPLARAGRVSPSGLFRNLVTPAGGPPPVGHVLTTGVLAAALAGLAVVTSLDREFAAWFVVGAVAALVTFRAASLAIVWAAHRVGRVRHPGLRLALANLYRPGAPTPSVVLSLGLGLTVLVAVALIEGNLSRQIREELPKEAPSFFFIDIQPDQSAAFEALVGEMSGIEAVRQVPMLRGRVSAIDGRPAREATVDPESRWVLRGDRGLTWAIEPPDNSPVVQGEWWPADYAGPSLISFDAETARGFGVGVGDTLTVNVLGREITGTIANLRHIEWSTLAINFLIIFSPGTLDAAPRTHIATVFAEPDAEAAVERAVTDRFANVSAIRVRDALETANGVVQNIGAAVRGTAVVTLLAGTIVLAGAVAAGHRRRVYDSIVLKVLGATRRDVTAAFALEYGILGLLSAAIAGVLGSAVAWAVLRWIMNIDWTFIPQVVLLTAMGSMLITLALGFIGTWRALGQKAAPLLRNE
ncbi:MAG: ABC transporter permease [Alphaproteobacteria bacterium]